MIEETIDLLKGVYPYFLWIALCGIALRIYQKKWTNLESLVLGVYLAFVAIVALQPYLFYGDWEINRRYLLIGVPLYLGWAADAVRQSFVYFSTFKKYPYLPGIVAAGLIALLLLDAAMPVIKEYTSSKKSVVRTAALEISHAIKNDWGDRNLTAEPVLKCDFYRSPRRPLVQSDIRFLGYLSGGQQYEAGAFAPGVKPDYIVSSNIGAGIPEDYRELALVRAAKRQYRILRLNNL